MNVEMKTKMQRKKRTALTAKTPLNNLKQNYRTTSGARGTVLHQRHAIVKLQDTTDRIQTTLKKLKVGAVIFTESFERSDTASDNTCIMIKVCLEDVAGTCERGNKLRWLLAAATRLYRC